MVARAEAGQNRTIDQGNRMEVGFARIFAVIELPHYSVVIEQGKGGHQIVAEEMLLWGWRGTPGQKVFLDHAEAKALLASARASSDLSPQARGSFLENELKLIDKLDTEFTAIAEEQSKRLVAAHERFSSLMDKQRFQVVYPVLPMDLLGLYILLPEAAS